MLGDNLFHGQNFRHLLQAALERECGATIFGYPVDDPQRYGVVEFGSNGNALSLEEKPARPRSMYAIPGLYFYDNQVLDIAATLKPSRRGELEITDVNREYLNRGQLHVERLDRETTWMDAGTHDSLLRASQFVHTTESLLGYKIGCIEEIAFREQFIEAAQLERLAKAMNNEYGQYLLDLARREPHAATAFDPHSVGCHPSRLMNSPTSLIETRNASDLGYASRQYAESFAEIGAIRELRHSGGWLIERPIANSQLRDGMGCYPLFCCSDWNALQDDLEALAGQFVSVRLVTDPFADVDITRLRTTFPDVCYEYKQHFATDLSLPLEQIIGAHHRRNVRKAMNALEVHASTDAHDLLPKWTLLYDNLIRRHGITGIARFSPRTFARQMRVPGVLAFSALERDQTCGMALWYVRGDVAYYHLAAYSDRGYELGASFALFWSALTHFSQSGIRWVALGAGAGEKSSETGLTRFKRGWATHTPARLFLRPHSAAKGVRRIGRGQSGGANWVLPCLPRRVTPAPPAGRRCIIS